MILQLSNFKFYLSYGFFNWHNYFLTNVFLIKFLFVVYKNKNVVHCKLFKPWRALQQFHLILVADNHLKTYLVNGRVFAVFIWQKYILPGDRVTVLVNYVDGKL